MPSTQEIGRHSYARSLFFSAFASSLSSVFLIFEAFFWLLWVVASPAKILQVYCESNWINPYRITFVPVCLFLSILWNIPREAVLNVSPLARSTSPMRRHSAIRYCIGRRVWSCVLDLKYSHVRAVRKWSSLPGRLVDIFYGLTGLLRCHIIIYLMRIYTICSVARENIVVFFKNY